MPFRCNVRNFFLTYSQAPGLSKDRIARFLTHEHTFADKLNWFVVCQESHRDQGIHFHVVVNYAVKYDCRNQRSFDIDQVHPKIEPAKDIQASIKYVKKDGDFLEYGEIPQAKRKWIDLDNAADAKEAWEIVKQTSPRDYWLNLEKLEYSINKRFRKEMPRYDRQWDHPFTISNIMQQWLDQRNVTDRPKSVILYGPSRTGKTAWARSIGPHMYFNGMFDLSQWNDAAEYAIFDDFPEWDKWRYYKQFLGGQYEITVTDKYIKKQTLRWGKPCIVLSNSLPNFPDMEWIRANCFIVNIIGSLF